MSNFTVNIVLEVDDEIDVICALANLMQELPKITRQEYSDRLGKQYHVSSHASASAKGFFEVNKSPEVGESRKKIEGYCECDIVGEKYCPMHCSPCECTGNGKVCWQCR